MVQKNMNNSLKPIVFGYITGFIFMILLMMGFAWLMTVKDVSDGVVTLFSYLSIGIGCFVGGFVSGRKGKIQGYKTGSFVGLLLFIFLMISGFIVNGIHTSAVMLVKFILSALCGLIGGVVGVNMTQKRKMKL